MDGKTYDLDGKTYHLDGKAFHLAGKTIHLAGKTIHLDGKAYALAGKTINSSGKASHLFDKAYDLDGKAYDLDGKTSHFDLTAYHFDIEANPLISIIFTNKRNRIMKVLLEVKDNKADFLMELLNSLSFVKAKTITPAKAHLIEEIKEAVEEMKLIKAGKKKARNAEEFLNARLHHAS